MLDSTYFPQESPDANDNFVARNRMRDETDWFLSCFTVFLARRIAYGLEADAPELKESVMRKRSVI